MPDFFLNQAQLSTGVGKLTRTAYGIRRVVREDPRRRAARQPLHSPKHRCARLEKDGQLGLMWITVAFQSRLPPEPREKVGIARLFASSQPRQFHGQRRWASLHHPIQARIDGCQVVKGIEALGAFTQFADGLESAQHQHTKNRQLPAIQIQDLREPLAILLNTTTGFVHKYDQSPAS